MKIFVAAFGSILVASAALAQTAPTKVGIINIQAAIVSTNEGKIAVKALEEKSLPKKRELEKLQGEIAGLRDKLNKMSSVGSEDEKRKLMAEIDQRTKSFNRQVEDAQAELDQEQNRLLQEMGGRMLTVLDKYSKDNGYAVVLDVSAQNTPVLFAASQVDLTQEVIALYDKNASPATSSVAPTTPTPQATKPATTPAAKPATPKPAPAK